MKKRILATIAMTLALVMTLSGCSFFDFLFGETVELTAAPLNAQVLVDFKNEVDPNVLFESDGWSNGDVFNVVWKKHNVVYDPANGIMRLGITEEKANAWLGDQDVEFKYTAGEARTQNYYHYGDYEVSMKPSANPGTASTFFICTGPYDLKDGVANPHDEIDIEFLGKDTTKVQFNFFVDGKGGNEYMYELGFDASKEFHKYGFRWAEDSITWFVDGVPVYKVTTDDSVETGRNVKHVDKLPSTAGRMLTNYWCGNERAYGWMGEYKGAVNDKGTEYQWIATSAVGAPLNPPVVTPPVGDEDTEIDWSAIEPIAPTFATTPEYNVVIDGNKAGVTYTDINGSAYKPIEMDVTDAVAGKNYLYLKVTNNGSETVQVRVNMYDPTLTGNNTATNISATMNGQPVFTDTAWGGSFFDIPAGETAELVLNFAVGGIKLQLMIDSSRNDSVLRSGDITIEDIKFTAVGEVEAPHSCKDENGDDICDECGEGMIVPPAPPADPVSGNLTTTIGGVEVELGGNVTDGYGVHGNADGTVRVEYTNISTNTYENVWAQISAVAAGKNEISLKIKNNGAETAYITVKIETTKEALMEGKMEIPAGEEQTYTGTFDGVADKLYFFIDSGWSAGTTTHAGEVVISEIVFSGEATGGGDPVGPTPDPEPDTDLQFNFWTSSDDYTTNGNNIKYNGVGNSYTCAGTDVAALAAGKNTFTVTITNNGAADSRVRVDIQGTKQIGNHTALNTAATGGDVWTDAEWGGSIVTVPAGQSVTLVITYDEYTDRGAVTNLVVFVDSGRGDDATYSSDVTLSGMAFSGESTPPAVDPTPDPTPDPDPTPVLPTDGEYVKFVTENAYTIIADGEYVNKVQITYTEISTNTWHNVNTYIADKAAGKTNLSVTLRNNGTTTVLVTVKLEAAGAAELANQKVELAAGEMKTVSIDFAGTAELLFFFIDSDWSETTTTHAGDISIAGIKFSGEATPPAVDPDPTPEPTPEFEGLWVEFKSTNPEYTIDTLGAESAPYVNSVKVTYTDLNPSWQNVNVWLEDKWADRTILELKITNNGTAEANVFVKIENASSVGLKEENKAIAAGETVTYYLEFEGGAKMIYFFIDSTNMAAAGPNSGDITISDVKLGKIVAAE